MMLKIFVPTYQRPQTLKWSLISIFKQNLDPSILCEIFVINNDPLSHSEVKEAIVDALEVFEDINTTNFSLNLIEENEFDSHGIKRIFNKIKSNTNKDDIVLIHCDDDIMLPDTLNNRVKHFLDSNGIIGISKAVGTGYFISGIQKIYIKKDIFQFQSPINNFVSATKDDLTLFSIPFLSVYIYRVCDELFQTFENAINWSDQLNFTDSIKYPFVPFFIGLNAYQNKYFVTSNSNVVIRGQLLNTRKFLPPTVITEYANTGIILLTGAAVLNNNDLSKDPDFNKIREEYRKNVNEFVLVSLFKRAGVNFIETKQLYQLANMNLSLSTILCSLNFINIRNLINNLVIDTRYVRQWVSGFGNCYNENDFWKNY